MKNKTETELIVSQLHEVYQKMGTFGAKNCGAHGNRNRNMPMYLRNVSYVEIFEENVWYPGISMQLRNVSYPHIPVRKMFHRVAREPGICFVPG